MIKLHHGGVLPPQELPPEYDGPELVLPLKPPQPETEEHRNARSLKNYEDALRICLHALLDMATREQLEECYKLIRYVVLYRKKEQAQPEKPATPEQEAAEECIKFFTDSYDRHIADRTRAERQEKHAKQFE